MTGSPQRPSQVAHVLLGEEELRLAVARQAASAVLAD